MHRYCSMAQVPLEQVLAKTGAKLVFLEKECTQDKFLYLAEYCDSLNVVGLALGLSEVQISDVDKDHRTTEEKRVALVQKWKQSFAFNATYKTFIQALLSCGRTEQATEICRQLAKENEDNVTVDAHVEQHDLKLTTSNTMTPTLVSGDEKSNLNLVSTASSASSNIQPCDTENTQSIASLQDKLDELEHSYRMITFNFGGSLHNVTLDDLQLYAASLPIRVQRCYEELKIDAFQSKTESAESTRQFVAILNKYSNFMNPALLGDAIKMFGNAKTKSEMNLYSSKLEEFQVSTKLEDFVKVKWEGVTPKGYEQIELELEDKWQEKTLKDISPPMRTWLILKVFEGSLRIIFSIPDLMDLEEECVWEFLHKHVKRVFVKEQCIFDLESDKILVDQESHDQPSPKTVLSQTAPEESDISKPITSPDKITFRFSSQSHGEDVTVSEDGLEARRINVEDIGNRTESDACVYIATPLSGAVEFELEITDSNSSIRGSLTIGVAQIPRGSYKHLDIPHDTMDYYCSWEGKHIKSNLSDGVLFSVHPYGSAEHGVECGDKVGMQITSDGDLSFSISRITQGVAAKSIYREERDTYLYVFLWGSTTAVKITRAAMSSYGDHKGHATQLETTILPHAIQFEFHPVTGKNIMLLNDGLYARRLHPGKTYYNAVVYGSVPIKRRGIFEVAIEELKSKGRDYSMQFGGKWSHSIKVGVRRLPIGAELKESDVPKYSEDGENHCMWCRDAVWNRFTDRRTIGNYGSVDLDDLQRGDKVGMRLAFDGTISFFINGKTQGVAVGSLNEGGYDIYPVVDVCHKCYAVRITRAEIHSNEVPDLQELCVEHIASCLDWSLKDVFLLPLPQKLKNKIEHYIDHL